MATYPSKSPASILSSTSAQMRLTTRRSTQRQQVRLHASAGSANPACSPLMKVNCIRCSEPSTCFQVTWFVSFYFYLPHNPSSPPPLPPLSSFLGRSCKGPVVHPEDSQSPGHDSCGRVVLPCSAAGSQRGLQAGQAGGGRRGERGAVTQPWRRSKNHDTSRVR